MDARKLGGAVVTSLLALVVVVGLILGDSGPVDRVAKLGASIRCPVCQGESILDSPSETAGAMMDIVSEKVDAGETDEQIIRYFEDRYGEAILLDPPFAGRTLMVWLLPGLAVVGGAWLILGRRRKDTSAVKT